MARKVFISYNSKDIKKAERLYFALKKAGFDSWMAKFDIKGGQDHKGVVPEVISSADVFILLLSKNSQKEETSVWVPKELEQALNEHKDIIPLQVDNAPLTKKFSYMLAGVQILPPIDGDVNYPELSTRLNSIVQTDPGRRTALGYYKVCILCTLVLAVIAAIAAFYGEWMDQRQPYLMPSGYVWVADSPVYYTPGGEIYLDEGWSAVFKKTDISAEIDGITWMAICPVQGEESHVWAEEEQLREVMEVTYDELRGEVPLDYDYAGCSHFRLKKDSELYGGVNPSGEKEQLLMVVPKGTIFYNEDIASDTYSGEVYWLGTYYHASGYVDEKNLEWMYTVY